MVEIFGIFECLLNKNLTNQHLNFIDSSKLYRRLLVNPKTGGSRKLFVFENDFKTYFSKTFDAYIPNKDVKLRPKDDQIPLNK